jgi:hypothetical protein
MSYIEVIVIERKTRVPSVLTAHSHAAAGAYWVVETKIDFGALGMNVTWLYEPKHYQEEKERHGKCKTIQMEAEENETLAIDSRRKRRRKNSKKKWHRHSLGMLHPKIQQGAKLQKQERYTKIDTKGNCQRR